MLDKPTKYTHKICIPDTKIVTKALAKANGKKCVILDLMNKEMVRVRIRNGYTFQLPSKWLVGCHRLDKTIEGPDKCDCPWSMLLRGCECGSSG